MGLVCRVVAGLLSVGADVKSSNFEEAPGLVSESGHVRTCDQVLDRITYKLQKVEYW